MDVGEAVQRIFRVRGLIVCGFLVVGLLAGAAAHVKLDPKMYTGSVRLVLGTSVPQDAAEAEALAGQVQGIITSQDRLSAALADANASRDLVQFTREISTTALSDSGVIELDVKDRSGAVAASVANTLADDAVTTINGQTNSANQSVLTKLQAQITALQQQSQQIDSQVVAAANNPGLQTALISQRSALASELATLIAKQADIQSQIAQAPVAAVISAATVPALPDPSHLALLVILGALAGLILGIASAAVLEMRRPTLVRREAIERVLEAPVLGVLRSMRVFDENELLALSARVRRAAETARASTAVLYAVGPTDNLDLLAQRLQAAKPAVVTAGRRPPFSVRIAARGERLKAGTAMILVVPPRVRARTLADVDSMRVGRGVTVLGSIVAPQVRRTALPTAPRRVRVRGGSDRAPSVAVQPVDHPSVASNEVLAS